MAIILAIIIEVIAVAWWFLAAVLHADGQRDDWSAGGIVLVGGTILALIIGSSHWWHLSW